MQRFSLLLSFLLLGISHGLKSYYSYEDATCIDSNTIKGTLVTSYDDSDYSDFGFSMSYYGGCLYLVGGSLDLESYDYGLDFYDYGTCVECDGVVGCSSDGTCDNFMTYPGTTAASNYQMTASGTNKEETSLPFGKAASQFKTASLEAQEYQLVEDKDDDEASFFAAAAGLIGGVALMGLVVVVRNWFKGKSTPKINLGDTDGAPTGQYFLSKEGGGGKSPVVV